MQKKELWLFGCYCAIYISRQNCNRFSGDVPFFIWHGSRPSYKHTKRWCVRFYIVNGDVTRNKINYRSHSGYFMGYTATIGVILYWNPNQTFVVHRSHHVWFDEYNYCLSIKGKHTPCYLLL